MMDNIISLMIKQKINSIFGYWPKERLSSYIEEMQGKEIKKQDLNADIDDYNDMVKNFCKLNKIDTFSAFDFTSSLNEIYTNLAVMISHEKTKECIDYGVGLLWKKRDNNFEKISDSEYNEYYQNVLDALGNSVKPDKIIDNITGEDAEESVRTIDYDNIPLTEMEGITRELIQYLENIDTLDKSAYDTIADLNRKIRKLYLTPLM